MTTTPSPSPMVRLNHRMYKNEFRGHLQELQEDPSTVSVPIRAAHDLDQDLTAVVPASGRVAGDVDPQEISISVGPPLDQLELTQGVFTGVARDSGGGVGRVEARAFAGGEDVKDDGWRGKGVASNGDDGSQCV